MSVQHLKYHGHKCLIAAIAAAVHQKVQSNTAMPPMAWGHQFRNHSGKPLLTHYIFLCNEMHMNRNIITGDTLLVLKGNLMIFGPLRSSAQWDPSSAAPRAPTSQDLSASRTSLVLGWISKHIGEDAGIAFALFHGWRKRQGQQRHNTSQATWDQLQIWE